MDIKKQDSLSVISPRKRQKQSRRFQPGIAIVLLTVFLDPAQLDKRIAELPAGSKYLIKHSVTKIDVLVDEIASTLKSAPK